MKPKETDRKVMIPIDELDGPTTEARVRLSPVGGDKATMFACYSDESNEFTVGNRKPVAAIVAPADGATVELTDFQVCELVF